MKLSEALLNAKPGQWIEATLADEEGPVKITYQCLTNGDFMCYVGEGEDTSYGTFGRDEITNEVDEYTTDIRIAA